VAQARHDRRRPDGAAPRRARSTVLTEAEEAIVVEFRRRTLLSLDDVLGCLREAIPTLSRSALHRCLRRHGISRLPQGDEKASRRKRFAETTIGYVHIDVCELRLAQGRLSMFLAIDRVSKFAHVAFFDANTKANGAAFLREVVEVFPYQIHTVLTDNGMAFADLPKNRGRYPEIEAIFGGHIFDRVCEEHGIRHRLTKPYHPWTNGQAERMNRTVKEATIKAFHYPDLEALKAHVLAFVTAYSFAKHLKALRWRTPFQAICDAWAKDPPIFKIDPRHLIPGPHT
jgi:transposase InsO family protein